MQLCFSSVWDCWQLTNDWTTYSTQDVVVEPSGQGLLHPLCGIGGKSHPKSQFDPKKAKSKNKNDLILLYSLVIKLSKLIKKSPARI